MIAALFFFFFFAASFTAQAQTHPSNVTITAGGNASFSISVGASDFQWEVSTNGSTWNTITTGGGVYSGFYTATLTLANVPVSMNGYRYRCFWGGRYVTNPATLTVNPALPVITSHPDNRTVSVGETVTFSIAATGATSYGWAVTDGTNTTAIPNSGIYSGANTPTLTISNVLASMNGHQFFCTAINAGGNTPSNRATLTITAPLPVITSHPAHRTVNAGGTATFSIEATGATSYQWEVSNNEGYNWLTVGNPVGVSGATTATLSISNVTVSHNAQQYRCVVTNTAGSVTSNEATLTVNAAAPVITTPAGALSSGTVGVPYSVTLSATNSPTSWAATHLPAGLSLSNSGVISGTPTSSGGHSFNVTATNSGGTSAPVGYGLTINPAPQPPTITSHPAPRTVQEGTSATFSVEATGTNLSYRWQYSFSGSSDWADSGNAGTTTKTLTITNVTDAHHGVRYRCMVTNGEGVSITSNAATLTVIPNSISVQGQNGTITTGMAGAVSFAVTTVGIPNGSFPVITLAGAPAGVTAGSITIAGNAATLTLNVPASIPAGSYPMTISINYGRPITSNSFTLTVSPVGGAAPVITSQPSDVTVNAGQNAEFKIVATGATSYSWSQSTNGGVSWNVLNNGGIYSGTATATLTLTNVPANMNGYLYYCVAMSVTGSAASNTATLTVNPVATKSVSVGSMSGDVWAGTGGSVTFPVSTEGIANGSYSVTITGAPAGVTTGALTVSANAATLTINVAASVAAGPRLLTLTIDGATSNTFSLYVRPAGSTALPVFNAHPTDLTVTAGQDASFSISAIGATSVRWQLKTGATWTDLTNNNTYAGVTGAKLTIATAGTAMNGYQYRCIATNANGSTESNPATLTVEAAVTITLSLSTASLDFTTAAGSQTFAIASNTDWTVEKSAGAAWLTVSPSSGSNDRTVTVTVAASTAAAARTATLTIKGTGVSAQTITVTQNGTVANEELTMDNGQLKAWANDGMLYISGNASGKQLSVYNISGTLVASPNPSAGGELAIPLPGRGVYIVTDGSSAVKVAY